MENFLAILIFESLGPIGHHSLSLGSTNGGTQIGFGRSAKDARGVIALGCVTGNDFISWLDSGDAFTNRFHNAASFVAQNTRKEAFGVQSVEGVNVLKRNNNIERPSKCQNEACDLNQ